ncbi:MAG: hypothetical protein R3F56_12435 [Planctomycetota bacterium]
MRRAAWFAALALSSSCAQLVEYAQDLTDRRTGRTLFVRTPATVGGFVGFAVGLPLSVVGLPVTYTVHRQQARFDPGQADALSTLLWPSFVLWRGGNLLATPFDLVEWMAYRSWRDPPALTRSEREDLEVEIDAQCLPSYPVEPIYPRAKE